MSKAIIGRPFTFMATFHDATGNPTDVNTPTIEVFYYDESGVKVQVVNVGTVLPKSNPAETGRYAYTLTVSDLYDTRVQLYGIMQGIDPGSGDTLAVEREVDLFTAQGGNSGLTASFVKPGAC